jgi:NitT/TauT family transport system substrate-binding protein
VAAFLAVTGRGFNAAATEQDAAAELFARYTPYFPPAVIARSLAEIAPTWFHDGRWGEVREELVAPYAAWLAGHGILNDPQSWRSAVPVARVALSA